MVIFPATCNARGEYVRCGLSKFNANCLTAYETSDLDFIEAAAQANHEELVQFIMARKQGASQTTDEQSFVMLQTFLAT